jgi:hypothetical protein
MREQMFTEKAASCVVSVCDTSWDHLRQTDSTPHASTLSRASGGCLAHGAGLKYQASNGVRRQLASTRRDWSGSGQHVRLTQKALSRERSKSGTTSADMA